MAAPSNNPAADWAALVSPTALANSLRVRAPIPGGQAVSRQASSGAYNAGTDFTATTRLPARNAVDAPQTGLLTAVAYQTGIPVTSFDELLQALAAGARTIRLCPGTYSWSEQLDCPALGVGMLTFIVAGGDQVTMTIAAALADAAIDLGAACKLAFYIEAGSALTITDPRPDGSAVFVTAEGAANQVEVLAADADGFTYTATVAADGVFIDATVDAGGATRIRVSLQGARILLTGGVANANPDSHFVRVPAGVDRASSGAVGPIARTRIEAGTILHTPDPVNALAGGVISNSTLTFSRLFAAVGIIDSTVNGDVDATVENDPTTLGTGWSAFLRGTVVRSAFALNYNAGVGFAAPTNVLQFAAIQAVETVFDLSGDPGQQANIVGVGANQLLNTSFNLDGLVVVGDVLFGGPMLGEGVSLLGGGNGIGLRDVEFSHTVPDEIRLDGLRIVGGREARFSDAPTNVIYAGNAGAAAQFIRVVNGVNGLHIHGGGANHVEINNDVANFVFVPWTGGVRVKTYTNIRNAMGQGGLVLDGAMFFQVADVFMLNGDINLGSVTPFDFAVLTNIVAASIAAVGNGGDSGFYANVAGTLMGSFFTVTAEATVNVDAVGVVRNVWATGASAATGLPFPSVQN